MTSILLFPFSTFVSLHSTTELSLVFYLSNLKINPNNKPLKRFSRKRIFTLTQYPLIRFSLLMRVINFRWSFEFNLLNNFCLLLFQWSKLLVRVWPPEAVRECPHCFARCLLSTFLSRLVFLQHQAKHSRSHSLLLFKTRFFYTHIRPNKTTPKWITIEMKNS